MTEPSEPRTQAAALVPVYRGDDGEIRLVLIRRTEGGAHGGHLAFPGGKRDPSDPSMLGTALREAWEEIGIDRETVQVLAHLPPMDTRTSGFRIHPFLARITRPTQWRRSEREVAEVLEVGLGDLARPQAHVGEAKQLPSVPDAARAPFYRVGPYQLWGVTYRILHPLIPRLLRGEWNV